jgi:hypothetical protein
MWSLWPLILGGWGLAKFVQSPPGEPKEGLVLMTAAAWLLVSDAGWIPLEDSWPLLVIAVGLIIAFNGGRRGWYGAVPQPAQAAQPDQPALPALGSEGGQTDAPAPSIDDAARGTRHLDRDLRRLSDVRPGFVEQVD